MGEDYVWDKTGEAETDLVALERTLSTLRHGRPLGELPGPQGMAAPPKPAWAKPMLLGAGLSAALTLLLIWILLPTTDGAKTHTLPAPARSTTAALQIPVAAPPPTQRPSARPQPAAPTAAQVERLTRALQTAIAQLQAAVVELDAMRPDAERIPAPAPPPRRPAKSKPTHKSGGIDCILDPTRCAVQEKTKVKRPRADIDCILEPAKCAKHDKTRTGEPADGLPDKLRTTDIKTAMIKRKAGAKACGAKHGGLPGEKVVVKLSIEGATGKVTAATATGKHRDTPLGRCIAAEVSRTQFPRFKRKSLGVQYPFRL